jgi:hypothetical protein
MFLPAILAAACAGAASAAETVQNGDAAPSGRTFHVSAAAGDDSHDGLSPQTPWRTLDKVNAALLKPGDKVLFHRGDTWRGALIAQSGRAPAAIVYGAYGQGEKPLLLGSVSRDRPADWHRESGRLWATARPTVTAIEPSRPLAAAAWWVYCEGGAKVTSARLAAETPGGPAGMEIQCLNSGSAAHHLQLSAHGLAVREGGLYLLTFRARSTRPGTLVHASLMQPTPPWTSCGLSSTASLGIGPDWSDYSLRIQGTRTVDDARITLFLGGGLPAGATLGFRPLSWTRIQPDASSELAVDVGNIIFDHGRAVGVKRWKEDDLRRPGDYCYCPNTCQVKLCCERNPAEVYRSVELALRRHIVSQGNQSYVTYENLALGYGAAHGFSGASTHHIVIRDCDIGWIGGGHQFTRPDGVPVRFGNGIEFWANAHDNLVEGCRIWEVYDAALTNQGTGRNAQINLTYRDNVIWNSEYSFEYWNRGPESTTRNVRFEHNTCVNAGGGWGHAQRPDRNGRHLMFYSNPARTTEFFVRDNIFAGATESGLRIENDWTAGLTMDRNCWQQPAGPLVFFLRTAIPPAAFPDFQKLSGLDAHSIVADPKFVDAARLDFRLSADSPARNLAGPGDPAGSRQRLEK